MALSFIISTLWSWIETTGLNLAIILVIALLVPRVGRLAVRIVRQRVENSGDAEEGKNQLAFAGVGVYIVQIIAFFILTVLALQQVGFSLAGAAIPATVASAAIGFGAQSIIADFLAGFFILTEKQFGVGDWVRFEGSGVDVEGTVIQITMRATKIRTISQETINIPNSAAKICINNSNTWSRAVVVMPVPMLGSANINEVILRSEDAARRALAQDNVAPEILGELDVHPAIDVQPPTVVGMPWMVSMRFLVQVTAGNHWMVERAIRTQIINEFWKEYGSATTTSGMFVDTLNVEDHPVDVSINSGAGSARPSTHSAEAPTHQEPKKTDDATTVEPATEVDADAPTATLATAPVKPEKAEAKRPDISTPIEMENEHKEDSERPGVFRSDAHLRPWQKVLSLGGRVRMSTTLMILTLMVLLVCKAFAVEPSEDWEANNPGPTPTSEQLTPTESSAIPTTSVEPTQSETSATTTTGTRAPTSSLNDTPEEDTGEATTSQTPFREQSTRTATSGTSTPATVAPRLEQLTTEPTPAG
ncbi:mechanosensitive ion channel family protein [Corynebacterium pacaense]|uniref:mechanosensitive ion channel family protein n=1 Tax=Corynebacterium pacaense TaxID=1816684 RepID=UPI001178152B|nr:mechanosensitive ion channel family protein [Corynebacterium pacaense]